MRASVTIGASADPTIGTAGPARALETREASVVGDAKNAAAQFTSLER
jgi:hypothetical protein